MVYRKPDLSRLDIFDSGYVSVEELQIITPRTYRLQTLKASILQILDAYCDTRNIKLNVSYCY